MTGYGTLWTRGWAKTARDATILTCASLRTAGNRSPLLTRGLYTPQRNVQEDARAPEMVALMQGGATYDPSRVLGEVRQAQLAEAV